MEERQQQGEEEEEEEEEARQSQQLQLQQHRRRKSCREFGRKSRFKISSPEFTENNWKRFKSRTDY